MPLLEVKSLRKKFGGLTAVDGCSFSVEDNSIVGLIGPNGSGKTTMFNLITGFIELDEGDIYFKDKRINGLKPYTIASIGIGRTFQISRVFSHVSVLDNMLAVSPNQEEKAEELLKFVNLYDLRDELAGNLSYGQQKLLEFVRILMLDPHLLMLDEPMSGVNPVLQNKMLDLIRDLRDKGKTFLIIEHQIPAIAKICDSIIVLDHGKKIAEGKPEEIRRDEKVIKAYFLA